MSIKAQGVNKKVAYKLETTWGTLAGDTGAKYLRRTTADFNLTKDSYESNEIRTDYQVVDLRGGIRSADGSLNGELSPGSYAPFFGSVLAKDFAAVVAGSAASITIATSGSYYTVTRSTGSFLTDGIQVGNVVRLTGAGLNAANAGNNLLVISMSATVLTVKVLSSTTLVAEGPVVTVTTTIVGKQSFVPKTGHSDNSYTIEQFYDDIGQSEVFTGMKVGSANIQLPSTGFVTSDFSFMGKDLTQTGTTQYFTTPTSASTTGLLTAVQGAMLVQGVEIGVITDANINIERAQEAAQVIGSNNSSDIFVGKIKVSGSLSAYFADGVLREYFNDETPVSIVLAVTAGEEKTADFITFTLPRCKLSNFSNSDSESGITSSIDFTALLNSTVTAGLVNSTIMIQDSQA